MKKKIMALLMAAVLLLAGCSGGDSSQDSTASGEGQSSVEDLPIPEDYPEDLAEDGGEPEEQEPEPEPMEMELEQALELLVEDEDGTYHIETADQLLALSVLVNSGDTEHYGKTFLMQNDIRMPEGSFPPIGGGESQGSAPGFGGIFDGGNYLLYNLTVGSQVANHFGNGLFGVIVEGGSVRNLHLSGGSVNGGSENIVEATGGLAGYCAGSISNCSFGGTVTSGGKGVGGLCGILAPGGSINGSFSNTETTGNMHVGGFVGNTEEDARVSNSYSFGIVYADGASPSQVGGFIGMQNRGEVQNCYSYMEVYTRTASQIVGGFIGYNDGSVQGCYYNEVATGNWKDIDANVLDQDYGVTGCTVEEMLEQATYAGWDFASTWGMREGRNRGLPFLVAAWDD